MGAAVKGYVSITTASGEIPGDDVILMRSERFVSAQADVETTKSDLELNSTCFGHTYDAESGEESNVDTSFIALGTGKPRWAAFSRRDTPSLER